MAIAAKEPWTYENDMLVAEAKSSITLLPNHEDLTLSFSFQLAEGATATLWFQDRFPVKLPTMEGIQPDGDSTSPMISVPSKGTGTWQDVALIFVAPTTGTPPLLGSVYLNGQLLYYQQALSASEQELGGLRLEVNEGKAAFTNFRSTSQAGTGSLINEEDEVVLQLPLIRYDYFTLPKGTKDVTNWAGKSPVKSGYINRFDINNIREKSQDYAIRFVADLFIPKEGEYTFKVWGPASQRLFIDDQLVVDNGGKHKGQEIIGKVTLTEGSHQLRIDHVQNSGWNALGVQYVSPDGHQGRLNSMGPNIATPTLKAPTPIELDEDPFLLRSFAYFPAPKVYETSAKRTHVISVGEKGGPHYSLDLQNGALLRAWKGEFANVGEMWIGRGEPQVMTPLGQGFDLDGAPQWASLKDPQTPWPDSLATDAAFRHIRHELDAAGRPTFTYRFGARELTDQLIPEQEALTRTLTNKGTSQVYSLLGSAVHITELSPGEFELRSPGIYVSILNNEGGELILQKGEGLDRLIAAIPAEGQIVYQLKW